MGGNITTLLLATGNRGKVQELTELFAELPLELKSIRDYPYIHDVEETGTSFQENAEIKAREFAKQSGLFSLADDSGLEIEALNGAPGVHSARFAGETTDYDAKISKLLGLLADTGSSNSRARFTCVMALAAPDGRILHTAQGVCEGFITECPSGTGGFGYDPIFVPRGFNETFSQLDPKVKRQISHRAAASRLIARYLLDFIVV